MCAFCQLSTSHEAERLLVMNYIDPGNGYVVQSMVPMILGILSTFFASLMFYFRRFFKYINKKKLIFVLLFIGFLGIIGGIMFHFSSAKSSTKDRTIIIGFDGMDPKLLQQGIENGDLPNFKKLAEKGSFAPLETSLPPQSPVAWASFITGDNPQKHSVYDFIIRHPKNYELELTFSTEGQLKSKPFWEYTTEEQIPTEMLFLPDTFPAPKIQGKILTGMGTPDITGTQGTAHFITSKLYEKDALQTKIIPVENLSEISVDIPGPRVKTMSEIKPVTTAIRIERDEDKKIILLSVDNKTYPIAEKHFSDWIPVTFSIDFFTKQKAIMQVYVKEVAPEIEVYVSPMLIDPTDPIRALSFPGDFSKTIVKKYGVYSTLGLPHDTGALNDGIFDDTAFLQQMGQITAERERIYFGELKDFKSGIFVGYFGFTDTVSHMFWRDPSTSSGQVADETHDVIMDWYKRADSILGKTMRQLKKDDTIIVISDHGFSSYDYDLNLNAWLRDNGYLVLKDGKEVGGALLQDVDWAKTKAYSVGYNGIYLNIKGREGKGIVGAKDAKKLQQEIREKLAGLVNPLGDNAPVVKRIYLRDELGIKTTDTNAPDIFVGFFKGTRPSSDAAIGIVGKEVITKRISKWTGDHLYDPSEVPGIFLSNKKITIENPQLIDILPTVLSSYAVDISPMEGKNLFNAK